MPRPLRERTISSSRAAVWSGIKNWRHYAPQRIVVLMSSLSAALAICVPRGVLGQQQSPGLLGGAVMGATAALACLSLLTPTVVFQFLAPDPSSPVDRELYLSNVGSAARVRLVLLTLTSSAGVALVAGVLCGAAAGLGDAIANHGRTSWAQVPLGVVGVVVAANVWQVAFTVGLALGARWRQRLLLMFALLPIPVGIVLYWVPSEYGARVAGAMPAGAVFARLLTVDGARRFPTSTAHDTFVLATWVLVPWILVVARHLIDRCWARRISSVPLPGRTGCK